MINNIKNFNSKTFFISSSDLNNDKKTVSGYGKLRYLIPPFGGFAGGFIGKTYLEKIHAPRLKKAAWDTFDTSISNLAEFVDSPQNLIDGTGKQRKEAYRDIVQKIDIISEWMDGYETPNCLLFEGSDKEKNKTVIDWFVSRTKSNYCEIDIKKNNILDALENLKRRNKDNGLWNLMYVKNMDK